MWEDISQPGQEYLDIAMNVDSDVIWTRLQQKHSSSQGWQIASYTQNIWRPDTSQPTGAKQYSLSVNSVGSPAYIA